MMRCALAASVSRFPPEAPVAPGLAPEDDEGLERPTTLDIAGNKELEHS